MTLLVLIGISINVSEEIVYGVIGSLKFYLNLAYLIPLLGLLSLISAIRLLPDAGTEKRVRALHMAMGLSAIAISWMFNYWNLIGVW